MAVISGGRLITGARDASLGPFSVAGAPTNGTSGTLAGIAPKGALLCDTTNAIAYINTGTQANPTWTKIGTQV